MQSALHYSNVNAILTNIDQSYKSMMLCTTLFSQLASDSLLLITVFSMLDIFNYVQIIKFMQVN